MSFILLLTNLVIVCFARPYVLNEKIGRVAYFSNQTQYSYSNFNMKGGNIDLLEYDVDFKDNYHSLDDEMDVEDITCDNSSLTIKTTSREIEKWGSEFYVSGTTMWNLTKIEYVGMENLLHAYKLATKEAKVEELFKTAKINYVPSKQQIESKKVSLEKEFSINKPSASTPKTNSNKQIHKQNGPNNKKANSNLSPKLMKNALKGASQIQITSPQTGNYYYTTFVQEEWQDKTLTSINVILRSNWYGLATTYSITDSFNGYDHNYTYYFDLPTNLKSAPTYYIQIEVEYSGTTTSSIIAESSWFNINVDPEVVITSPVGGDIIETSFDVTWITSTDYDSDDMIVWFMRETPWESAEVIDSIVVDTAVITTNKVTFDLPSDITSGSNYYIQITYANSTTFWQAEYSNRFIVYVDDNYELPVQITSPTFDTKLEIGDTFRIQWVNTEEMETEYLNVYIYQDIYGIDPLHYKQENVRIVSGYVPITIPSTFPVGSDYYVYLTYNCDGSNCDGVESERFSVNKPNELIKYNSITIDGLDLTLNVTMFYSVSSFYFTIKEDYPNLVVNDPVLVKRDIGTLPVGANQILYFTLPRRSAYKLYFTLTASCQLDDYVCRYNEHSERFDAPYNYTDSNWNYNSATGNAIGDKSFFNYNCITCSTSSPYTLEKTFCESCSGVPGGDILFSAKCENCYAVNTFSLSQLAFDYDLSGVLQTYANFEGHSKLNTNFYSKIEGVISESFDNSYIITSNLDYSFSVGPLDVVVELNFDVIFKIVYDFQGLGELSVSFSQEYDYSVIAEYPSISGDYVSATFSVSEPQNTFEFGANSAVTVDFVVGLEPEVVCDFFTISASVYPILSNYIQAGTKLLSADEYSDYPHFGYATSSLLVKLGLEATYNTISFADTVTKDYTMYENSNFISSPLFEVPSTSSAGKTQTILIDPLYKNMDYADTIFVGFVKELASILQEENSGVNDIQLYDIALEQQSSGSTQNDYALYDLTAMVEVTDNSLEKIFDSIEKQDSYIFSSLHPFAMKMKSYIGTCQIENCVSCGRNYVYCSQCSDSTIFDGEKCYDPNAVSSSSEEVIESSSTPEESSSSTIIESSSTPAESSSSITIESSSIPEESSSSITIESSSIPEESSSSITIESSSTPEESSSSITESSHETTSENSSETISVSSDSEMDDANNGSSFTTVLAFLIAIFMMA
ncbi:Uncharacterized protein QTN25_008606 [Entamoeba marina]